MKQKKGKLKKIKNEKNLQGYLCHMFLSLSVAFYQSSAGMYGSGDDNLYHFLN